MTGKSKTLGRLEAFKTGTGVYGANTSLYEAEQAKVRAEAQAKRAADDRKQTEATRRRRASRAEEAAKTIKKRIADVTAAARSMRCVDDLLDLTQVDLRAALSDRTQWEIVTKSLAKAAQAIEQASGPVRELRETVARMEPPK